MLEQVSGKLIAERVLVVDEPLAVTRGQEDPVLVRHIRARHGVGLVLLHLPGQLASELDRPHLGAEDTAERALDEACDLALETSEDTHPRRLPGDPCYGTPRATLAARRPRSNAGATRTSAPAIAPITAPRGSA